jgi:adenylate cyclase
MPDTSSIITTVMFADICGSTHLFSQLGDTRAASLVNATLGKAADLVKKHNGVVLRTKGDDVLCIFPDPLNALHASMDIHAKISRRSSSSNTKPAMSIGINSGPAILSEGDILGDTVNTAARLASFAKAGQTLISSLTLDMLENLPSHLIRPFGEITLRGKSHAVSTFEVLDASDKDEITQVSATPPVFPPSNRLTLRFQGHEDQLDYLLGRYTIGRNCDCTLVIDHPLVSRIHAEIRYQNNEFMLVDLSTNGTELITSGRSKTLHHSQAALRGMGSIFLGRTVYNRKFEIAFHASGGVRSVNQTYS